MTRGAQHAQAQAKAAAKKVKTLARFPLLGTAGALFLYRGQREFVASRVCGRNKQQIERLSREAHNSSPTTLTLQRLFSLAAVGD